MRRVMVLVSLLAVVLLGGFAVGRLSVATAAQEGTPPADEFEIPEGVAFEPLAFGTAEELPAAPADLVLIRYTIDPEAGFPIEEDDPGVALVYVESGALTIQIEAPIQVTRAATIEAFATPEAVEEGALPGPEEVAAGTEVTLEAGDSVVIPPNVGGEIRNDGTEPVEGLVALVAPPEEGGATPAA